MHDLITQRENSIRKRYFFLFLFLFFGSIDLYSQNPHIYYYENEFNFTFPVDTLWSLTFGLGNRGILKERQEGHTIGGYQHDHIEFNQFTNYKSSEALNLSLGLRYRIREAFDPSEVNEFRIIEQVEYEHLNTAINLEHRIRLEQRFRENTIHRIRYELELNKSLGENYSIGAATEALYAVSSSLKPEVEQRFSFGLQNTGFDKLGLELKLQYRMENYSRDLEHEYFVITEMNWDL